MCSVHITWNALNNTEWYLLKWFIVLGRVQWREGRKNEKEGGGIYIGRVSFPVFEKNSCDDLKLNSLSTQP